MMASTQPASDPKKKAATMTFGKGDSVATKEKPVAERAQAPAIGSALPGMPPVKLLTSREQNPTEASPLTYREYAFAVPAGTSEGAATEVLRGQLRLVEAHIATAKAGKLVNLAVFDVEFKGKPPRPPLATLAWKDWKGEPVIGYPARGGKKASAPPPAEAKAAPPRVTPAPQAKAEVPDTVPTAFPAPAPPAPQPQVAAAQAAPPPAAPVPAPVAAAVAVDPAPPPPRAPPAPHTAPLPEMRQKLPSQPHDVRPKTASGRFERGRQSGDELITSLFEVMHDLHFLRDALDGGQFCLALATEVLPSRAGLIHFFDIDKREWVVACTRGKDTHRLLTMRSPESDELLRAAARSRRAVVTANAAAEAVMPRYQQLGGAQSIIIAPIMQAGRALGAIEIVNPSDGMPFTENEGNAMTYIAEQYAEYLGSRGIVLDRDRIQSAAQAAAR
jgi:hypothetical protein